MCRRRSKEFCLFEVLHRLRGNGFEKRAGDLAAETRPGRLIKHDDNRHLRLFGREESHERHRLLAAGITYVFLRFLGGAGFPGDAIAFHLRAPPAAIFYHTDEYLCHLSRNFRIQHAAHRDRVYLFHDVTGTIPNFASDIGT